MCARVRHRLRRLRATAANEYPTVAGYCHGLYSPKHSTVLYLAQGILLGLRPNPLCESTVPKEKSICHYLNVQPRFCSGRDMKMIDHDACRVRKQNRHQKLEAKGARPVVHGALRYLGHRANAKHERKRLALLVRAARGRG